MAAFPQSRQQASAAAIAGEAAASSGLASSRSTSLKAWLGMRARFSTMVGRSCGTSGLAAWRPPWALRRLRESTHPPTAWAVITSKERRSWRVIRSVSSASRGTTWLGMSGSSLVRRGQDRVVIPSRRTQGRGAAARWLAGHQTAQAPGSRLSGRRSSCNENSSASGGARRSASVQSARAAFPSNRSPASAAAFGPWLRRSRTGTSTGRTSTPSVRRECASSSAHRH